MPGFLQDLRYGLRGLRRNPGSALAAVVAAALGIGASTAVFSAIDRILFRPLPYAGEDRLVSVGIITPLDNNEFLFADGYLAAPPSRSTRERNLLRGRSGGVRSDGGEAAPALVRPGGSQFSAGAWIGAGRRA